MDMEQQKPYPWEDEEEEENDAALQLQGRQSRQPKNSTVSNVIPTYNGKGHQEGESEKANSNYEELNKEAYDAAATEFAEEVKEGIFTGVEYSISSETNHKDEEWDVHEKKLFDIQTSLTTEVRVSHQNVDRLENESLSAIQVESREEQDTVSLEHLDNTNGLDVDVDLIEDIDPELTEYDVEKVIEKQNTHDLFCPNCNSCITRRVILRRRKRRIGLRYKPKLIIKSKDQLDGDIGDTVSSNVTPTVPAIGDREPDIFRCLSCFSFFIPTGNGFKRFSTAGKSNGGRKEEQGNASTGAKTNWFLTFFSLTNIKKTDIGNKVADNTKTEEINQYKQPAKDFRVNVPPEGEDGLESVAPVEPTGKELSSEFSGGKTPEETIISSKQEEEKSKVAMVGNITGVGNWAAEHSDKHQIINQDKQPVRDFHVKAPQDGGVEFLNQSPVLEVREAQRGKTVGPAVSLNQNGSSPSELPIKYTTVSPKQDDKSDVDALTAQKNQGGDVIVVVSETERTADETSAREGNEWDILKSIVYGGLVESITSLGVVSSAAGGGATTLNILAMGLANLIGGLFIVGHNLRELKNEQSGENSNQMNDRYQKVLGRRENFSLHATVAVISFLFFGLLPPIIYAFSFRRSDNRDLKLAAVLGASGICIILLAIAKCRVKKPPKSYIKTILYYLSTGVVASCVSYLVGELIKKLVEKLGWFDSSSTSTVAISFTETSKPIKSTWASY